MTLSGAARVAAGARGCSVAASVRRPYVEIAVQDLRGVRIALEEGADCVELCAGLSLGGLTPSRGVVDAALETAERAGAGARFINVLVRPRPGDFHYDDAELDVMCRDISFLRAAGVGGVVVAALDEGAHVDLVTLERLMSAAGNMPVTFHRAIDVVPDPIEATSVLARAGVRRVLSSGRARAARDGADVLRELVEAAAERLEVVAGGGVRVCDIPALAACGVAAVHLSARRSVTRGDSGPGGGPDSYDETDAATMREAVALARSTRSSGSGAS